MKSYCDTNVVGTQITYPICIDDYLASTEGSTTNGLPCPAVQCIKKVSFEDKQCIRTPSDTIDYLPPAADSVLDDPVICTPPFDDAFPGVSPSTYGMDEGMPPLYRPITPLLLNISGRVYAQFNDRCEYVENAKVEAWQINPLALNKFNNDSQFRHVMEQQSTDNLYRQPETINIADIVKKTKVHSLRDVSCRGMVHTGLDGQYAFMSLMPPSYGPPRHIMFTISAPGFKTLNTRMYFDKDWRLLQLTTNGGRPEIPIADVTNDPTPGDTFPGVIAEDPRVAKVSFVENDNLGKFDTPMEYRFQHPGFVSGYWRSSFNFILSPLRMSEKGDTSEAPPIDIAGLWTDNEGG